MDPCPPVGARRLVPSKDLSLARRIGLWVCPVAESAIPYRTLHRRRHWAMSSLLSWSGDVGGRSRRSWRHSYECPLACHQLADPSPGSAEPGCRNRNRWRLPSSCKEESLRSQLQGLVRSLPATVVPGSGQSLSTQGVVSPLRARTGWACRSVVVRDAPRAPSAVQLAHRQALTAPLGGRTAHGAAQLPRRGSVLGDA
jgi:hypothetical protein